MQFNCELATKRAYPNLTVSSQTESTDLEHQSLRHNSTTVYSIT